MKNNENDIINFLKKDLKPAKDYLFLVRTNLKSFLIIFLIISSLAIAYSLYAPNKYESTTTLRIVDQKQSVLQSNSAPQNNTALRDRFIANAIELIESHDTRVKVAEALIDSIQSSNNKRNYKLLLLKNNVKGTILHKNIPDIAELLKSAVGITQKSGMDVVDLTALSPSPQEAELLVNTYAEQYKKLDLLESRKLLTDVREFLEKQCNEKLVELNKAENKLAEFKAKGGIIALDEQSKVLITQLSRLDAERDAVKIDLESSNAVLDQYKKQINKQDPQLATYLESQTSQAYIDALQKQIAELQMNRDLALANKNTNVDVSSKVKDYDKKINDLKQKLTAKINDVKTAVFSSSPNQIKALTTKLIGEEIENRSLSIKLHELQNIINNYEVHISRLPKKSMELAGFVRNVESMQQLYVLLEQKYQESLINELSQPGNVSIISRGDVPSVPSKPKRILISLIGIITGLGAAFGYILIKDYFDDTIKTPDDIQERDIKLLTWIPKIKVDKNNINNRAELIVMKEPHSSAGEAFRALRTRILLNKQDSPGKIIMISSAWQGEGKTMITVNLANSIAQLKKKTLLVDCDLRRPRIHKIMNVPKSPGLVDYLTNNVYLNDIINNSSLEYMKYINAGSISSNKNGSTETLIRKDGQSYKKVNRIININSSPADPTGLLTSESMSNFLKDMSTHFDYVIMDSAPLVTVIDSEILATYVDGIILVVSAETTENRLFNETLDLIKEINAPLLGIVLNNFKYKHGYEYYFKYHYNYPANEDGENIKKRKII